MARVHRRPRRPHASPQGPGRLPHLAGESARSARGRGLLGKGVGKEAAERSGKAAVLVPLWGPLGLGEARRVLLTVTSLCSPSSTLNRRRSLSRCRWSRPGAAQLRAFCVTFGALGAFYGEEGMRWQRLSPEGGPPRRWGHSMTYEPTSQSLVVFGGPILSCLTLSRVRASCRVNPERPSPCKGFGGGKSLSDTWIFDLQAWGPDAVSPNRAVPGFVALLRSKKFYLVFAVSKLYGFTGSVFATSHAALEEVHHMFIMLFTPKYVGRAWVPVGV